MSETADRIIDQFGQLTRRGLPGLPAWVKTHDLTFGQLRVLTYLQSHGPTSMTQLAAWLCVSPTSVTGTVDRLEQHGLVERRHRGDDRRVVDCCPTARCAQLMREVGDTRFDFLRSQLAVLDEAELTDFEHLLGLIVERTGESNSRASCLPE